MKIVFMGTPDFSVPALDELIKSDKHEVVCVVTQTDKEKGRGRKVTFSAVKQKAIESNIEVFQPLKIKDSESVEYLKTFNADVFVVVAYGQVLSKELLEMPKIACLNIHGSILPKYRGPAPIHHAIIDGEKETGATIMLMDEGLDTGDILDIAKFPIGEDDTLGYVYDKMRFLGASLLIDVLDKFERNEITTEKQDESLATYAPLILKDTGHINFNKDAKEVHNLVRGLNPMPSAFFNFNNEKFKVHKAYVVDNNDIAKNGEVLEFTKKGLIIKCSNNAICITEIQRQGKKAMDISAFYNGYGTLFNKGDLINE